MIKCCTYTTLMVCFGPVIFRAIRRSRRPDADWVPTSQNVIKNLIKKRFQPEQVEEGAECVICFMTYEPNDEII